MSGFLDAENQKKFHENDFQVVENGVQKDIRVPILKVENIGPNMAIDEKQIGEEMHTVLSNRDTGKIALLARTLRANYLSHLIKSFDSKGFEVKTVTRDLANNYDWFCRQAFPNAGHIADKFHIIKSLLDSGQAVRIKYRQELLRERRLKFEAHKAKEKQREIECKNKGKLFKKKTFLYREKKATNGETPLELLARSRYLLYKFQNDWTDSQRERAKSLFAKYPEIEKSYKIACKFRKWYSKKNIGTDVNQLNNELERWFNYVEKQDVDEMTNFKSLVERNKNIIIRYFEEGATNAIAENINSKIQRFVMINQGTRDREFFYFRMSNYFS